MNAEQLHFRPAPESWTALECAGHIAVSEDNMFKEFHEKFLSLAPQKGDIIVDEVLLRDIQFSVYVDPIARRRGAGTA